MNNYEVIIGIEVHVALNTKHKIFSPSLNDIDSKPNTNIHPIDLGFPGALPRFNYEVLEKALTVCCALEMNVTKDMHWDRKNYFYHDNPKGYQITQFETPIGRNGKIVLDSKKEINIEFMHMEEDTAKSLHQGGKTLLDFNRAGVPLIEIVTSPDMRSPKEAKEYLEKLKEILLYIDASDCKMEKGSLRVDANVSVRPFGASKLNPKVEIKNLNSFANVEQAIEVEIKNQIYAYNNGQEVIQATKRYLESSKTLEIMRVKEGAIDYRYFPEPDLPWIHLEDNQIEQIKAKLPLLPNQIKLNLKEKGLSEKEIGILMKDKPLLDFFLQATKSLDAKVIFNYLTTNVNEYLNKNNLKFNDCQITVENFEDIIELQKSGLISSAHIKKIIPEVLKTGQAVKDIIEKNNWKQIVDETIILDFVNQTLENNQQSISDYHAGKDKAFGFLVGQIMKTSKGQASPEKVNSILKEQLEKQK